MAVRVVHEAQNDDSRRDFHLSLLRENSGQLTFSSLSAELGPGLTTQAICPPANFVRRRVSRRRDSTNRNRDRLVVTADREGAEAEARAIPTTTQSLRCRSGVRGAENGQEIQLDHRRQMPPGPVHPPNVPFGEHSRCIHHLENLQHYAALSGLYVRQPASRSLAQEVKE